MKKFIFTEDYDVYTDLIAAGFGAFGIITMNHGPMYVIVNSARIPFPDQYKKKCAFTDTLTFAQKGGV